MPYATERRGPRRGCFHVLLRLSETCSYRSSACVGAIRDTLRAACEVLALKTV